MKKNRTMRVAALLLALTLMTSCFVGGTFAKYTTAGESMDQARVAKFGVVVTGTTGEANQMFAKEYAKTDLSYTESDVTVASSVNVVAPGTSGTFSNFAVTGTPEVAVRVTYTPTVELGNNWIDKYDNTKFYCPIKVTINGVTLCGLDYTSADAFETAIADHIRNATEDYAPGTDLSVVNSDLVITWQWDFESDGTTYLNGKQTDELDTFLGDRAAGDVGNAGTISIEVTCTIDQID